MDEEAMMLALATAATSGNNRNKIYHDRGRRVKAIRKCRKEIKRLENHLNHLLLEDEMEKEDEKRKKKKLSKSIVTTIGGCTTVPMLHLSLEFLDAADVVSCAQVCHSWNVYVDTHPSVWKVAAEHAANDNVFVPSLLISSTQLLKPKDYFKNVALGLIRMPRQLRIEQDMKQLKIYRPFLREKQFFVCIAVRRKTGQGPHLPLVGPCNVKNAGTGMYGLACLDFEMCGTGVSTVQDVMSFVFRVFRADTGQSILWDFNGRRVEFDEVSVDELSALYESDRKRPNTNTYSGIVATDLWRIQNYVGMYVAMGYKITSVAGSRDKKNVFVWCRFCVDRGPLVGRVNEEGPEFDNCFESMKDLILSLEGLDWN